MKNLRFLLTFILSVSIFCGMQSSALAKDVWIFSKGDKDFYLRTHLIKEDLSKKEFLVPLKIYDKNPEPNVVNPLLRGYVCRYMNGAWYVKWMSELSDLNFDPINNSWEWQKIFDACVPYCELARRYPR